MSIIKNLPFILFFMLIISGCSLGSSPEEEIHNVLESTVKQENNFKKQEESLGEIEEKEQVVYNKLSQLDSEEMATIHKLAKEATELAEKRRTKIKQERENILDAKKESSKVTPLIEKIEKNSVKEAATKTKTILDERYGIYEEIYNQYIEGIENDIALYKLLQSEDVNLGAFQDQVKKNNDVYKKVEEANLKFNEKTSQFNESKKAFHKAAGIKVKDK